MKKFFDLLRDFIERFTRPRYKDCPYCGATVPARRSICPSCAKYLVN